MSKAEEGALAHGSVAHLLPPGYKRLVSEWLEEDAPSFDYGGFVVGEDMAEARLLGKSEVSDRQARDVVSDDDSRAIFPAVEGYSPDQTAMSLNAFYNLHTQLTFLINSPCAS